MTFVRLGSGEEGREGGSCGKGVADILRVSSWEAVKVRAKMVGGHALVVGQTR